MGEKQTPRCPEKVPGFLKENKMAAYKLPERLEIVHELPMVGDSGKIDKKILRQEIAKKLESV